jgi:hypothetical protein
LPEESFEVMKPATLDELCQGSDSEEMQGDDLLEDVF